MQVGILGPVEAHSPQGRIAVGGPRPRTLLALLAIRTGEIVPLDRLIDELYGEQPPSARPTRCRARCRGCAGRSAARS